MLRVRQRLRDPIWWAGASQLLKTVAAAVAAWVVAHHVVGLQQSYLAPWAALLVVNATVYRTVAKGAQQVGATVLGVLLAFGAGNLLGTDAGALTVALLLAMLVGTTPLLKAESTTAATTALVVLLTGSSGDGGVLADRLLDTAVGIGVGLLVNLLVWPPLHDRSAARRVDRIDDALGDLMTRMGHALRDGADEDEVDGWVAGTRDIDTEIDDAWATVRTARESGRLNPRRSARRRVDGIKTLEDLLRRLEQANAELRSLARTIGRTGVADRAWDPEFRDAWIPVLIEAGEAVADADAYRLDQVREGLEDVAGRWFATGGADAAPVHGALLVNLRNVVDALGPVVVAQPVRVEALAGGVSR